jgi:hypothetical protein
MRRGRFWTWIALGAVLLLVAPAGNAAETAAGVTKPFKYTYRITDLTVNAEYKTYGSKATSVLRLDEPSKLKWISWFGPDAKGRAGTYLSVAALYLTGEARYSSPDPSCASHLQYKTSKSHPVTATVQLYRFNPLRLRVVVRKFPVARAYVGRDSGPETSGEDDRCGTADMGLYETAQQFVFPEALKKPSFVLTDSLRTSWPTDFIPGEDSIDWTLKMTVKRVRYHLIDCATEPGC